MEDGGDAGPDGPDQGLRGREQDMGEDRHPDAEVGEALDHGRDEAQPEDPRRRPPRGPAAEGGEEDRAEGGRARRTRLRREPGALAGEAQGAGEEGEAGDDCRVEVGRRRREREDGASGDGEAEREVAAVHPRGGRHSERLAPTLTDSPPSGRPTVPKALPQLATR